MKELWEQQAVKHPGRVREYVARLFGEKAFEETAKGRGRIKEDYLNRAEMTAQRNGEHSLVKAIELAKRFRSQAKKIHA